MIHIRVYLLLFHHGIITLDDRVFDPSFESESSRSAIIDECLTRNKQHFLLLG